MSGHETKTAQYPKVSIIMGVYNCEDTLEEAIASILAQTYPNWELVICDDASTDRSYAIAKAYQEKDPHRFLLLRNEENRRLSYSLNRCLGAATGELVARMDADDLSDPNRLERQVAYLQSHPEFQLVGTAMVRFHQRLGDGDIMHPILNPTRATMRQGNPFFHATIMTYRSVYEKLGGYTVSKRTMRAQDYDLWFRFYAAGFEGNSIDEPLYYVREDMSAFKRRTIKGRFYSLQTTIYGYSLLGFPKRWLVRPILLTIGKSLVPYRLVAMKRSVQTWLKKKMYGADQRKNISQ